MRHALLILLALSASAVHAAAATQPNIIFIFTDDQRFDTIAALGNPVIQTPHLDRLARRGVSFRNHYIMGGTWGAVCVPSRNMMLTGRTLFRIAPAESILNPATEGEPTGHYAMLFKRWGTTVAERHPGTHSTDVFADDAVSFIERQQGEKPFFLYLAFHAPHDPIMAPAEYEALYPAEKMPLPSSFAPDHAFETGSLNIRPFVVHREKTSPPYTPEAMRRNIAIYYAMITHLDAQVGRILAALEANGLLENTIVVFSSDNGFSLGDHGLNHKQSVYEQNVRVPLILSGPGLPQNETRDQLCFLLDLFPTLCDLVDVPIPASVEGKSLLPVIRDGSVPHRPELYFAYDNYQRGCRDARYKLIEFVVPDKATGAIARHTLLFDLHEDPGEEMNLADHPAHAETMAAMRALLRRLRDEHGDTVDRGSVFWKNHSAGRPRPAN